MKQDVLEPQARAKEFGESFPEVESAPGGETWCYAKALRTLGQVLEVQRIESVDLEVENSGYVVRGKGKVAAHRSFSKLIHAFVRGGSSKNGAEVSLRYTANEIQQLDHEAQGKRQDGSQTPDPYSLSQMLRAMGSYLDNKNTSLVGITTKGRWITLRYRTMDGQLEQAKHDVEYFFDYWVKMYLQRKNRERFKPSSKPTLIVTWEGLKKLDPTH